MSGHALPPALAALFPSAVERARLDGWLTAALLDSLARVRGAPVTPPIDMARFAAELGAMDFDAPRPIEQLLEWTLERMEHGIVQMTNPRYFGLFNPGANFPSQFPDRISSGCH